MIGRRKEAELSFGIAAKDTVATGTTGYFTVSFGMLSTPDTQQQQQRALEERDFPTQQTWIFLTC